MNSTLTLARNTRIHRARLGLTQIELGLMSHHSQSYIALIEAGRANLTLTSLDALAQALNVPPGSLLTPLDWPAIHAETPTRGSRPVVEALP